MKFNWFKVLLITTCVLKGLKYLHGIQKQVMKNNMQNFSL